MVRENVCLCVKGGVNMNTQLTNFCLKFCKQISYSTIQTDKVKGLGATKCEMDNGQFNGHICILLKLDINKIYFSFVSSD